LIYVFHSVVKNPTSAFQYLHWPHFSFFLPLLLLVLHQKPAKNALRSKSNKPGKTTIIQIQKKPNTLPQNQRSSWRSPR